MLVLRFADFSLPLQPKASRAVIFGWTREPSEQREQSQTCLGFAESRERKNVSSTEHSMSHGGQYDAEAIVFTSKQNVMQQHIYYIKYALQFADMQIPELVNTFNQQVQSRAWSSMRAYHDKALLDEFQRRGIDTSAVSNGKAISFAHPIRYDLPNNRLVIVI